MCVCGEGGGGRGAVTGQCDKACMMNLKYVSHAICFLLGTVAVYPRSLHSLSMSL